MWQETGQERESRTNKCMSGLVWLGEREHDAAEETVAVPGIDGRPGGGGAAKRFVHLFVRGWTVPEGLARGTGGVQNVATVLQYRPEKHSSIITRAMGTRGGGVEGPSGAKNVSRRPKWAKALTDLSLSVGDMVCVSSEGRGAEEDSRCSRENEGLVVERALCNQELDHVRLLTGNIAAVYEDAVEVFSEKRMRVPRRGGRGTRGPGGGGVGSEAGEPIDIEDLLGGRKPGSAAQETVLFRIDKDEWAAGIK